METKTMATRQAEIKVFRQATGYTLTERADGWLYIKGGLDLRGLEIEGGLPERIEVEGDVLLAHSDIRELPAEIIISGDLFVSYTEIETIPEGVKVGGKVLGLDWRDSAVEAEVQRGKEQVRQMRGLDR